MYADSSQLFIVLPINLTQLILAAWPLKDSYRIQLCARGK